MSRLEERIRIGIVGLGWVGQEVARAALEDARVSLVGVTDVDPVKAGRDLGEILGEGRLGVSIDTDVESMLARARPEVAVVCTTSDVELLGPALESCVAHGAHVVTTCENLAEGDVALAQLDPGFDERAREAEVVVLATGVNPGFAMDRLPVMLAQATRQIRRIRVARVVDASSRRAQLQPRSAWGARRPSSWRLSARARWGTPGCPRACASWPRGSGSCWRRPRRPSLRSSPRRTRLRPSVRSPPARCAAFIRSLVGTASGAR